MRSMWRAAIVLSAVSLVVGLLAAGPTQAVPRHAVVRRDPAPGQILTVTKFTDPMPVACTPSSCSLREAILLANTDPLVEHIYLPAGTYTLSSVELQITEWVIITDLGPGPAIVQANGATTGARAFEILGGTATFQGVSVKGGQPLPDIIDNITRGGGIRVDHGATLTMIGGTVSSNIVLGGVGEGGGIYNAGTLNLEGTTIADDTSQIGFGGGIYTEGSPQPDAITIVNDSVFRDNTSAFGGALSGAGRTTVTGSLFTGNASGLGGAVYAFGLNPWHFDNTTFSGNSATDIGGAIRDRGAAVFLNNSTVSGNDAGVDGGAFAVKDDNGTTFFSLANTIVAGNTDGNGTGSVGTFPDCVDQGGPATPLVHSGGHNLIGITSGCVITAGTGDQVGTSAVPVNPLLGPLVFNGGVSIDLLTLALLPGSPAIDAGDPATPGTCVSTDARGVSRNVCDIGAYEFVTCHGVVVNRVGTAGDDTSKSLQFKGTGGADGFLGFDGNDSMAAKGGDDSLCGGPGDDRLIGGKGNDHLFGGPGNDKLNGGPGSDQCKGGPGNDIEINCETKRLP